MSSGTASPRPSSAHTPPRHPAGNPDNLPWPDPLPIVHDMRGSMDYPLLILAANGDYEELLVEHYNRDAASTPIAVKAGDQMLVRITRRRRYPWTYPGERPATWPDWLLSVAKAFWLWGWEGPYEYRAMKLAHEYTDSDRTYWVVKSVPHPDPRRVGHAWVAQLDVLPARVTVMGAAYP